MKKVNLGICVLAAAGLLLNVNFTDSISVSAEETQVYAEYIAVENAPVIDGKDNDAAWDLCSTQVETDGTVPAEPQATVKILWNETGLYFYAEIFDSTVNNSDRCNFWISETYYAVIPENPLLYPETDDAYYLCLSPNKVNNYHCPEIFNGNYLDMEGKYTVETTYLYDGYTMELYIPFMSEKAFQVGDSFGFEISVDDYLYEVARRNTYTYWKGQYYYWEYPYGLGEIVLRDTAENENASSGTITEPELPPTTGSSSSDNENGKENTALSGCKSVNFTGSVVVLLTACVTACVAVIRRKNN